MKQYSKDEYIETFGEQMWQKKVEDTLGKHEKEVGVASVYATDKGNIFIINLNEQEF